MKYHQSNIPNTDIHRCVTDVSLMCYWCFTDVLLVNNWPDVWIASASTHHCDQNNSVTTPGVNSHHPLLLLSQSESMRTAMHVPQWSLKTLLLVLRTFLLVLFVKGATAVVAVATVGPTDKAAAENEQQSSGPARIVIPSSGGPLTDLGETIRTLASKLFIL